MPDPIATLFSTPAMSDVFSTVAHVRGMLSFECGLARVQAKLGVIPAAAADAIAAQCRVELFDVNELYELAARAGTPVIPLVKRLTELVVGEGRDFVHWGATSQDAMDSALMLQLRSGIALIVEGLDGVCARCAALSDEHRSTVMAGRTLLQQAVPITFGLRAARWLSMCLRCRETVRGLGASATAVQLGGAAGSLAALADSRRTNESQGSEDLGLAVLGELGKELGLPVPDLPWHAERDRIGSIASQLGVVAGAMAKIANDVVLLSQTEVAEAFESGVPGQGASSTMPQKRNPVDATRALAAARLAIGEVPVVLSAMSQAHERGTGDWQAEWAALPSLFRYVACAVDAVDKSLGELRIDPKRMAENLELSGGLIMAESLTMALAREVGRPEAQQIVGELCREGERSGRRLAEVAIGDSRVTSLLTIDQINRATTPSAYLGSTEALIERTLLSYRANLAKREEA